MTKAHHTPGPWTVNHDDGESVGILGNNGNNARGQQYVAAIQYSEAAQKQYLPNIPSHEQAKANARLIAAAPELLQSLELLLNLAEFDCMDDKSNEWRNEMICARSAAAKAKGE